MGGGTGRFIRGHIPDQLEEEGLMARINIDVVLCQETLKLEYQLCS